MAIALTAHQQAAVERMSAAARSRNLQILWQGRCKVAKFAGARVWGVQSASRPERVQMVWIAYGRLMCTCEARKNPHVFTCSHAQAVRLHLLAEAAEPRSIPTLAPDDDDPTPPSPPLGGATCPVCGFPADPDEIDQLGECLDCLQDANRAKEQRPPLCDCGQIATGETADGFVCDACTAIREAERITARQKATKQTRKSARARAAVDAAKTVSANAAAKANTPKPARKPSTRSADRENPNPAPSPAPVRREDAIFRTKTMAGRA